MLSPWMKSTFSGNGMAERARSMPSARPVVTVFMMSESQRVVPPNLQPISASWFWHSSYAPVRRTERFKTVARGLGLVAYWRERGWPALCHPVGATDFACE